MSDAKKVSYVSKDSLEEIETSIKNKEVEYAMIPYNMNLDFILENDLNIVYHLTYTLHFDLHYTIFSYFTIQFSENKNFI